MGVNEEALKTCSISSNGSCTTNAASPLITILDSEIGIKKAALSTVHGYTASQALTDGPTRGKDFRRGRAAAVNIIPSTTGAAISVTKALPTLAGKFDGMAMRVPVAVGSIIDITFVAKKQTSVEEVNEILEKAAKSEAWKDVLATTKDPIVSSDIIGQPYGSIADLSYTKVIDGDLVKVCAWYDNEWGYVTTLVQHLASAAKHT
jgi:glyceraldehyde 3-phosphate dehydrogenase